MWAPNGGLNIQLVSYCGMKNRIKKAHQFQFWDAKNKITSIFTNKKAVIFTMAAFIVISMLFSIYNQKNHHFFRDFYTYKICGNNFITAIFMSVKSAVNVLVIQDEKLLVKLIVKIIVIFNTKNNDFGRQFPIYWEN